MRKVLLLAVLLLAACGSNTEAPTGVPGPEGRVQTPIPAPPTWQEPQEVITRENVAQVALLGRLDVFGTPSTLFSFDFSPDGTSLIALNNDQLVGWDLITGERFLSTSREGESFVFYSPDKTEVYTVDTAGRVRVYDTEDPTVDRLQVNDFVGHPDFGSTVAYHDDTGLLALGGLDGTVKVWDTFERRSLVTFDAHERDVNEMAFSADGERLATASGDQVIVWDWREREAVATLDNNDDLVRRLAFSPDGERIAAGTGSYVAIWLISDALFLSSFQTGPGGSVDVLTYSPDGQYIVAGGAAPDMIVADAETGEIAAVLPGVGGDVASAAFSPDGELLIAAVLDGPVTLWDMTQITDETVQRATLDVGTERVIDVAFTSDGFLMLFFDAIGPVYVWGVPS